MIRDLDRVLANILDRAPLPGLADASISFDRPTEPYSPSQTTINLFLYDIRQNTQLRSNEPIVERRNGEALIRQPPMRIDCTYLITAWVVGGEETVLQEHHLLSQVLQVLSAYPTLSEDSLRGTSLENDQEPFPPMMLAQMDGIKNPAEFWAAIGNKLRASLTVTVTLSIPPYQPKAIEPLPLVITHEIRFPEPTPQFPNATVPPAEPRSYRIGGRVTAADGKPVKAAQVTLVETGVITRTDDEGHYQFSLLTAGTYTLRVQTATTTQETSVTVRTPAVNTYNLQLT